MEAISAIWDSTKWLCDCSAKHAAFICHLEDNLQSLTDQWTELQNRSQDVKSMLQQVETRAHMRRTKEVDGWLQSVDSMEQTIEDIKKRGAKVDQDKCLVKLCHKNCLSSYCLGKEVVKTLDLVKVLMEKGERFGSEANIAHEQPHEPVDDIPVPKTIGMDLMLKKAWDSVEDERVGLIGLFGMGGVGKTTLMKRLNNELVKRQDDSTLVIWAVVSKYPDIDQIMEDIRRKCQIGSLDWKDESRDKKAREIFNVLKQKKFVLLLDDVWDGLELHSIGVPYPHETSSNQFKVLFTTRFENVCDQMQAKKFKVECLTKEEAFDLFCMNVGEETINSDPVIQKLAKEVMQECKGLPLALITIAKAMAGRKNPKAWRHAIKKLKTLPSEIKDMEKEVFFTLKFSYDSLPSAIHKSCLLYFALFQEDAIINVSSLIRFWIGEGLLADDSIHDAINHGEDIVESLKLACLLEDGGYRKVKMHDVIRDMTIWLTRDQDQSKEKILLQGEALRSLQETWRIAERISIIYDNYAGEPRTWDVPICPNLVTLIVHGNGHMKADFANVQFMSKLKVLSLRKIEGITTLLAKIGLLIHLEYLELRHLEFEQKLPIEMKNLKKLKVLRLTISPEMIPLEVMSCLKSIRLLSLFPSTRISSTHCKEELFLEQLELLPLLEYLNISIGTLTGVNKLLGSTKLQRYIRNLRIRPHGTTAINTPIMTSLANMEHLEYIYLEGLQYNLEESFVNHIDIFRNLRWVGIIECHSVTHLTWLKYAPLLDVLHVCGCTLIEEVIMETADDEDRENMDEVFANLNYMTLEILPKLRNIYRKALPFHKLERIRILKCPNLKNLPLGFNSATKTLKQIRGETRWWNNLEWVDPIIKSLFNKKFRYIKSSYTSRYMNALEDPSNNKCEVWSNLLNDKMTI